VSAVAGAVVVVVALTVVVVEPETIVVVEPETVVDVVDPVVEVAMTGDALAAVGAEVTMPVGSLLLG
jgi:hypothetical protein